MEGAKNNGDQGQIQDQGGKGSRKDQGRNIFKKGCTETLSPGLCQFKVNSWFYQC